TSVAVSRGSKYERTSEPGRRPLALQEARRLERVFLGRLGPHRDPALGTARPEARRYHRHPDLAGEPVVDGRAEDDVRVVGCGPAHDLGCLVDLVEREIVAAG